MPWKLRMSPAVLLSCLLALASAAVPASAQPPPPPLRILAAASLQGSLDEVVSLWSVTSGRPVQVSYSASSSLARQIEQGAPAHVFISADQEWMDHLEQRSLIDPATRKVLVRNRLVVVAPAREAAEFLPLAPGRLAAALGPRGRLALAETTAVPAGRYARQALMSLGLWDEVSGRLAEGQNVRAALAFVARGESPLGIVYASDAIAEPKVRVVAHVPASSHAPIVYPVARVRSTLVEPVDADGFLRFLASPEAAAVFARAGFDPP